MTTEKIEVVAPLRVSARTIHAFVQAQQEWVLTATDKMAKNKKTIKKLSPDKYKEGVSVPYQGEQNRIQLQTTVLKKVKIALEQSVFTIDIPVRVDNQEKHDFIRLALIDWMKDQALKQMKAIVDIYAEKYNLYPRMIRVKTQKSRWGSCGIHNDINLNWLLILTPAKVMEYVVIHELCHIKERNHSAKFWLLVETHCPDYREHRRWLKQNGHHVMQGL